MSTTDQILFFALLYNIFNTLKYTCIYYNNCLRFIFLRVHLFISQLRKLFGLESNVN